MADMTEDDTRRLLVELAAGLFARGFSVGSAGNISVRLADGYLITPTNSSLGRLDAARPFAAARRAALGHLAHQAHRPAARLRAASGARLTCIDGSASAPSRFEVHDEALEPALP